MIDILRRRGIRTLAKFLHVLKESLDGWIADKILCTDLRVLSKYILLDDRTLSDYIIRICGPPTPEPKTEPTPKQAKEPALKEPIITKRPDTPRQHQRQQDHQKLLFPSPPSQIAEVPGQVQHLHHVFEGRRQQIDNTLSILKQEEQAIKDILEKNVEEQRHLNKNQQAITDISRRLQSIHHEAGQLLKSAPTGGAVRNRLSYLHGVPWDSTLTEYKNIEHDRATDETNQLKNTRAHFL